MKFTSKKILTVLIALLTALIEHDDDLDEPAPPALPEYKPPKDNSI